LLFDLFPVSVSARALPQEELYSSVSYTGLNLGSCFGRLLVVRDSKVPSLSIQDLVVLRYIPNDITHVAGNLMKKQLSDLINFGRVLSPVAGSSSSVSSQSSVQS